MLPQSVSSSACEDEGGVEASSSLMFTIQPKEVMLEAQLLLLIVLQILLSQSHWWVKGPLHNLIFPVFVQTPRAAATVKSCTGSSSQVPDLDHLVQEDFGVGRVLALLHPLKCRKWPFGVTRPSKCIQPVL